jgi:uncharacterized protein (TIGR02996 family)
MSDTLRSEAQRGIWAAIRNAPYDDVPRLIYADWLDENGESERAELIRVQCEQCSLAIPPDSRAKRNDRQRLDARAHALVAAHGDRWLARVRALLTKGNALFQKRGPGALRFRRGFLDAQPIDLESVRRLATAGDALEPCDRIWIGETDGQFSHESLVEISQWSGAASILGTSLAGGEDRDIAVLVSSPHFRNLANFAMWSRKVTDAGVAQLADWPLASALRTIDLRGTSITEDAAFALAKSSYIGKLCLLDLGGTQIGITGYRRLRNRFASALQMYPQP